MILRSLASDHPVPTLPYRLKVLAYSKSFWSRVDYYTDHALVAQQQGSYFGDIVMESPREGRECKVSMLWLFGLLVLCYNVGVFHRGAGVLYSTSEGSDNQHQPIIGK